MPKVSYETALEYPVFERIARRKIIIGKNSAQLAQQYKIGPRLLNICRYVRDEDAAKLRTSVSAELNSLRAIGGSTISVARNPGVAYSSSTVTRRIYEECYRGKMANSRKIFNSNIKAYHEEVNEANPRVAVRLGEISVLGAVDKFPSKKFLSAELVPAGSEAILWEEHEDYYERMIPEDASGLMDHYASDIRPHLSIGFSRDAGTATRIADALNESGALRGLGVQLEQPALLKITHARS